MNFSVRKNCLLCQSSDLIEVRRESNNLKGIDSLDSYLRQDSVLVKCTSCGFAFVKSIPSDDAFYAQLYRDDERDVSIDYKFSGKRLIFKEVLKTLGDSLPARTRLLDIGAGTGAFVKAASEKYEASGIELSDSSVAFAQSQHLPIRNINFMDLRSDEQTYDALTLIDVLEHLPDPAAAISKFRALLNSQGYLFIKVPNYPAQAVKQDLMKGLGLSKAGIMQDYIHINHFTMNSLCEFLNANGFKVHKSGFSLPEVWDLAWPDAPKSVLQRRLYNWTVLTITKFLNLVSSVSRQNLGLNFWVLARKI